jgi:hypothetical protein
MLNLDSLTGERIQVTIVLIHDETMSSGCLTREGPASEMAISVHGPLITESVALFELNLPPSLPFTCVFRQYLQFQYATKKEDQAHAFDHAPR